MLISWSHLYFEKLGGFMDNPLEVDISDLVSQPVGDRVYHINHPNNESKSRQRKQRNWHQVLGRVEDYLFSKSIPMNPIEMVGICNFDNIIPDINDWGRIDKQPIYMAGPDLRQLIIHDDYYVAKYYDDSYIPLKLNFFIVGESPELREASYQQLITFMTRYRPYAMVPKSDVVVDYLSPETTVLSSNNGFFHITIHVTESPSIQHYVMTHFDYDHRLWAAVEDLVIWALPSSDYSLKTFANEEPPLL